MANRLKPYRERWVLDCIQDWFDRTTKHMTYPKREKTLSELFMEYNRFIADQPLEYGPEHFMAYEDFGRCLHALGIVDVSGEGSQWSVYKQLEDWRPSLDQIRRLKVPSL